MTKELLERAYELDRRIKWKEIEFNNFIDIHSGSRKCSLTIYANYGMGCGLEYKLSKEEIDAIYEIRKRELETLRAELDNLIK